MYRHLDNCALHNPTTAERDAAFQTVLNPLTFYVLLTTADCAQNSAVQFLIQQALYCNLTLQSLSYWKHH